MLKLEQARQVVFTGIVRAGGSVTATAGMSLQSAGVDSAHINMLASAIVNVALSKFDHGIDYSKIIKGIISTTTIGDLSTAVFELALGKVCSGPLHHPQPYPAPSQCGDCGSDVP